MCKNIDIMSSIFKIFVFSLSVFVSVSYSVKESGGFEKQTKTGDVRLLSVLEAFVRLSNDNPEIAKKKEEIERLIKEAKEKFEKDLALANKTLKDFKSSHEAYREARKGMNDDDRKTLAETYSLDLRLVAYEFNPEIEELADVVKMKTEEALINRTDYERKTKYPQLPSKVIYSHIRVNHPKLDDKDFYSSFAPLLAVEFLLTPLHTKYPDDCEQNCEDCDSSCPNASGLY